MDTTSILNELKRRRDALDAAIAALAGTNHNGRHRSSRTKEKTSGSRKLSAAARQKMSDAAKARWLQAKKAGKNSL